MLPIRYLLAGAMVVAGMVLSGVHPADARTAKPGHSAQIRKAPQTKPPLRTQSKPQIQSRSLQNASRTPEKTRAPLILAEPARTANGSLVGAVWSLPGMSDGGRNKALLLAPASTMKVFTAAAALTQLGQHFRFRTAMRSGASPSGGVLKGDLIIDFAGDPTFSTERLLGMLDKIKEAGIKSIQGNVIINASISNGYTRGAGWPWDDLPLCFAAPAGAVVIDHNCIITKAQMPRGARTFSRAALTQYQPAKIVFDTQQVPKAELDQANCTLIVEPSMNNTYTVSGCIAAEKNQKKAYEQEFKFAVQDPNLWAREIIKTALRNKGIALRGNIVVSKRNPSGAVVLAESFSPELPAMIKHMLKYSDNLFAETIAAATARSLYGQPVSIRKAALGVKQILQQSAGVSFAGADLYDGSGLSSYSLVSADTMLQVLKYVKNNDSRLHMIELLPVSGESGTLLRRASVVKPPLKGQVVAKTGTIRNVRNLAGFVKSVKGNLIPFVVFHNSYYPDATEYRIMQDENKQLPHFEYERNVLTYLYEEKTPVFR
ncbi:MAG: D-alanyl-D-alanine carboxypeptidase/D-alanyl-D-alanine-endopeptidase [Succinivibrionaceae bacterium]|nr:D-alanyl-D-alanine carboxypeptidase/D-alanyl-D-alanine-endopeptidase [Succinivibrionaceae bacterium]